MTITVNIANVCSDIAALSVSGVKIYDIDEIPESAENLGPFLTPQPVGFVTAMKFSRVTFGGGGTAKMDLEYDLNYAFIYAPVGGGLSEFDAYSQLIAKFVLILTAIFTNDNLSHAVDMQLTGAPAIGLVEDPSAKQHWGATFSLHVLEQIQ